MRRDHGPGGTRKLRQTAPPAAPGKPAAGRRLVLAAAGVVLAAAAVAALALWGGSRQPPPAGGPDVAVKARPAPGPDAAGTSVTVVEPVGLDAGGEAVARVTIVVQPIPQGARVMLGGRLAGVGRVQLELQRSRRPVTLEVSAPGHRSARKVLVPDRDRSVKVRLVPVDVVPDVLDDNPYKTRRDRGR